MARRHDDHAASVALVGVFAAMIAAFSLTPAIPVGVLGVPITLQTLAVFLTGMILGPRRAFLATLLYLVVGLAGLPVFAGGMAGLGAFGRPSIGYLVSFPLGAALTGWLSQRLIRHHRFGGFVVAALISSVVVIRPLGIIGMMTVAHLPVRSAIILDAVYWPGDIVKILLASWLAVQVNRAFPTLLGASTVIPENPGDLVHDPADNRTHA